MGFQVSKDRLNKNGLTSDYLNEFNQLQGYIIAHDEKNPVVNMQEDYALETIKPIMKYTERYDKKDFPELITPKNNRRITRINELVEEINNHIQQKTEDTTVYKALAGRIGFLVRGTHHIAQKNELRYDFSNNKHINQNNSQ